MANGAQPKRPEDLPPELDSYSELPEYAIPAPVPLRPSSQPAVAGPGAPATVIPQRPVGRFAGTEQAIAKRAAFEERIRGRAAVPGTPGILTEQEVTRLSGLKPSELSKRKAFRSSYSSQQTQQEESRQLLAEEKRRGGEAVGLKREEIQAPVRVAEIKKETETLISENKLAMAELDAKSKSSDLFRNIQSKEKIAALGADNTRRFNDQQAKVNAFKASRALTAQDKADLVIVEEESKTIGDLTAGIITIAQTAGMKPENAAHFNRLLQIGIKAAMDKRDAVLAGISERAGDVAPLQLSTSWTSTKMGRFHKMRACSTRSLSSLRTVLTREA